MPLCTSLHKTDNWYKEKMFSFSAKLRFALWSWNLVTWILVFIITQHPSKLNLTFHVVGRTQDRLLAWSTWPQIAAPASTLKLIEHKRTEYWELGTTNATAINYYNQKLQCVVETGSWTRTLVGDEPYGCHNFMFHRRWSTLCAIIHKKSHRYILICS